VALHQFALDVRNRLARVVPVARLAPERVELAGHGDVLGEAGDLQHDRANAPGGVGDDARLLESGSRHHERARAASGHGQDVTAVGVGVRRLGGRGGEQTDGGVGDRAAGRVDDASGQCRDLVLAGMAQGGSDAGGAEEWSEECEKQEWGSGHADLRARGRTASPTLLGAVRTHAVCVIRVADSAHRWSHRVVRHPVGHLELRTGLNIKALTEYSQMATCQVGVTSPWQCATGCVVLFVGLGAHA
jgi:hypothetical protein